MIGTPLVGERSQTLVDDDLNSDSVESFSRRFEAALAEFAAHGIDAGIVEELANSTKVIDRDLDRLYAGKYPKKCNTCGIVYETRADYMKMTRKLRSAGTYFDADDREVQEYRDCECGSSLLVLVSERRDESPFGLRRREMFDVWLARLAKQTRKSQDELTPLLRQVFRAALGRAREGV